MTTRAITVRLLLAVLALGGLARADGRPGTVAWSDGRKVQGNLSLTPGKDLRLFTNPSGQVSLQLADVSEIRFEPEKEVMQQGFYFPDAGQATQARASDVYPVRYLSTRVTLGDGKVLSGHLFTTVLYVETDDGTEKVILAAKQSGADGEKLADLVYPMLIRFEGGASSTVEAQIDLTSAGFVPLHPPVVVAEPDLAILPTQQIAGKQVWTVVSGNPGRLLFGIEAADGIHVTWPPGAYIDDHISKDGASLPVQLADVDPTVRLAVKAGLRDMQDFYDTRDLLGSFAGGDGSDIYSLVMLRRLGKTEGYATDKKPWSLVFLRWKYDAGQGKVTLLNRAALATGRTEGSAEPPAVLRESELLRDVSAATPPK